MSLIIANTKYGTVRGRTVDGYTVFKGIRFAKPPAGNLRFCPPEPPEPFSGIFDAGEFGSVCPQSDHEPGSFYYKEFYGVPDIIRETDEDCLNLNIWTPAERAGEKLPVAVWIHGGAFFNGYNSEVEFDGAAYAKRGVVLVTINYRLGVFGFFCHPWLTCGNPDKPCGNWGILDQIAAIRYVRDNIEAFGGDPDRITVFGQSAGAMSTQTLLLSPLTEGLFHRAILQSGGGVGDDFPTDITLEQAMDTGELLVKMLGVSSLTELRSLPWKKVQAVADKIYFGRKADEKLKFLPTIDGYTLTDSEDVLLRQGRRHRVPCMLGATADDLKFSNTSSTLIKGCENWALNDEKFGLGPDYIYYFTRRLPGDTAGAFHSSELWFVFRTLERSWRPFTEADKELSDEMVDCWTEFIKTGCPSENWPPYTQADPFIREFDIK